jgi:hypothetical protein
MTSEQVLGLRDDVDFRRYWLARVCSLTGSLVTAVAMPVLIYRLTGSELLTALTTTLEALPYAVFGLVAGAVGDRWDRRRVMITSDAVNVPPRRPAGCPPDDPGDGVRRPPRRSLRVGLAAPA